jgi:hypothetical protein
MVHVREFLDAVTERELLGNGDTCDAQLGTAFPPRSHT